MNMKKLIPQLAMALAMVAGSAQAVVPITGTASTPVSSAGVTPYIIPNGAIDPDKPNGGNRTCADVGEAYFGNVNYYACKTDKVDAENVSTANPFPGKPNTLYDNNGNPITNPEELCQRNSVSVEVTDDTFVAFQATVDPIGAAIIKGGPEANTYVYQPGQISDSGLASPVNNGGNTAALSNIGGFCWNPVRDPEDPISKCYTDETAWAAGTRFVKRGNWATYTSYSGVTKTVSLLAGQFYHAGDVTLAPEGSLVKITVALKPGFRFALNPNGVNEDGETIFKNNLKIQPYDSTPAASNPAPGLFSQQSLQTTSTAVVLVPVANFYGIHVDIEREIPCPVVAP